MLVASSGIVVVAVIFNGRHADFTYTTLTRNIYKFYNCYISLLISGPFPEIRLVMYQDFELLLYLITIADSNETQ